MAAEIEVRQPTVIEILADAVMRENVSIDVVERLAALQRQTLKDEQEIQFNDAMHRCQEKMKRIAPDKTGDKGKYASYAGIDKIMRPIYTSEGFSLSFSESDCPIPEYIRLICYVSRGGHTRKYQKDWPIVTKGPKGNDVMTPTHAHGSADSYAKRYLLKDIFNVSVGEDDDDGAMGRVADSDREKMLKDLEEANSEAEINAVYRAASQVATKKRDGALLVVLNERALARKKEIANA